MRFILLFALGFSSILHARSYMTTPLLLGGTTAALVTGTQAAIYETLIRSELKGWTDVKTGSTVQLEDQCQVEMEFHLAGNHRTNLLLLGVTNSSGEPVAIKYRDIRFIYNGNRVRYPGFTYEMSDKPVGANWWQISWVPFPSKGEFRDVDHIKVQVPIRGETSGKSCVVEAEFKRRTHIPEEEISYSAFELNLDMGPALTQSGNVKELGKPDFMVSFEVNFYPRPNHGFGMVLSGENGFKGNNTKLDRAFDGNGKHEASISYFGLQYIYRHYFNQDLFLSFGIGPGFQIINDSKNHSDRDRDVATNFTVGDKLMLNWVFSRLNTHGPERADFYFGLGVGHFWTPSASVKGQDLSGQRLSGLFRIGMGL